MTIINLKFYNFNFMNVILRSQQYEGLQKSNFPAPPPPPPRESEHEIARRKRKDDYKLRELRIFLRDICRKLASNRRFYKFTKPVDLEEVSERTTERMDG